MNKKWTILMAFGILVILNIPSVLATDLNASVTVEAPPTPLGALLASSVGGIFATIFGLAILIFLLHMGLKKDMKLDDLVWFVFGLLILLFILLAVLG